MKGARVKNGEWGSGDILDIASDQPKTISRRVAVRRLSDSPLIQTSGNSYFLSEMMDTL
jgi:hypothetical protein